MIFFSERVSRLCEISEQEARELVRPHGQGVEGVPRDAPQREPTGVQRVVVCPTCGGPVGSWEDDCGRCRYARSLIGGP